MAFQESWAYFAIFFLHYPLTFSTASDIFMIFPEEIKLKGLIINLGLDSGFYGQRHAGGGREGLRFIICMFPIMQ